MDKTRISRVVKDYIYLFMNQLHEVELMIGIPAQTIQSCAKLTKEQLDKKKETVSYLIQYFAQCKHLTQKDPEKYYMWLATHEHGGEVANYIQIERKYCQMIYLVDMVFQKAGLQDEFKQAVAKANEELKLWRKEQSIFE